MDFILVIIEIETTGHDRVRTLQTHLFVLSAHCSISHLDVDRAAFVQALHSNVGVLLVLWNCCDLNAGRPVAQRDRDPTFRDHGCVPCADRINHLHSSEAFFKIIFLGYFDPVYIIFDSKNKYFSG